LGRLAIQKKQGNQEQEKVPFHIGRFCVKINRIAYTQKDVSKKF
jgi:hypothetical protein